MEMVVYDSNIQKRLLTLTSFPRSQGHLFSCAQDLHSPLVIDFDVLEGIFIMLTVTYYCQLFSTFIHMYLTLECVTSGTREYSVFPSLR